MPFCIPLYRGRYLQVPVPTTLCTCNTYIERKGELSVASWVGSSPLAIALLIRIRAKLRTTFSPFYEKIPDLIQQPGLSEWGGKSLSPPLNTESWICGDIGIGELFEPHLHALDIVNPIAGPTRSPRPPDRLIIYHGNRCGQKRRRNLSANFLRRNTSADLTGIARHQPSCTDLSRHDLLNCAAKSLLAVPLQHRNW